jgi:flagellar motor switch protein FliG
MNNDGLMQSAILLLSIGEEHAAEVFKHLSPKEVEKLGTTIAELGTVRKDQLDLVLKRFENDAEEHASVGTNNDEYIQRVLTRALGEDKAGFLLSRIVKRKGEEGIETLKWMDPALVAELIHNEHPQIIATILVHLERDTAAEVIKLFNERTRNDVVLRIATMDGVQPLAMRELNEVLSKLLSGQESKSGSLGGVRTAAEILNYVGSSVEAVTVEALKEVDPDLAQKIQDEMFLFENLAELDDRSIQIILREVQSESLVVALKGADEGLREKIFKNMSSRAAEMLRDDLSSKGPVRISEVEAEQKEILKTAHRLAEEGQIMLGGGGADSFV